MVSHQVKHADEGSVGNCHLYNHPFWKLYEIIESGDEGKALFTAATRKDQTEVDHVIGDNGTVVAVTMLWDDLMSSALCVCLGCAAPVVGACYKRRETQEIANP